MRCAPCGLLQSVPRGREPIFVISCNERIIRSAVGTSTDAPAELAPIADDGSPAGNERVDGDGASRRSETAFESAGLSPDAPLPTSDHDHPALAFVDKLLTIRVLMPPTMSGDMRRFAHDLVPAEHPLRSQPGLDFERILAILVHDGVDDPRSVIRLLNRFVAALLLGREREDSGRVFEGDVTHHMDVLAQLAVILDEFPDFYDDIAQNPVLLGAASKIALRNNDLSPSERDALVRSTAFTDDRTQSGAPSFRRSALRRYLSGTARLVRYPADVGPLIYFTATPGGRSLGVELRNELMSALRAGDSHELAAVLGRVPSDRTNSAGEEIADILRQAPAVDAPNYLAAVAPNLPSLDTTAGQVADACADLIDRAPDEIPPPEILTAIIDHAGPGRDALLCERLVRHVDDPASTNNRLASAAAYLATHARIRSHVEPALLEWASVLPNEGGWDLARPWLDVAEGLDAEHHMALLRAIVGAMTGMVRTEVGFASQDGDRLVALAEKAPSSDFAPRPEQLATIGPNTESTFVRLWKLADHSGGADEALLAAAAAKDPAVTAADRRTAVELVTNWSDSWKDATQEAGNADTEPIPVTLEITVALLEAASDPTLLSAVSGSLCRLAAVLGSEAAELVNGIVTEMESAREEGLVGEAEIVAVDLIAALDEMPEDTVKAVVARLLSPVGAEVEPSSPRAEMARRLVPRIARLSHGSAALAGIADVWAGSIRGAGSHDDRSRLEGFRALHEAAPDIVASRAAPIYSQVEQLLQGADDPPGRLRVLGTFPWPDEQLAGALAHLDAQWESVPDDARLSALSLASRAPDGLDSLARFHDRVTGAVEAEPSGVASAIAASSLPRMSKTQRARVFAAAVGLHTAVTRAWSDADDDEVASTVALSDADGAGRLIANIPAERRAVAARCTLVEIVTTDDVPLDVIDIVAGSCDSQGLQVASDAALAVPDSNSRAASALRVAISASEKGASLDHTRVDELICAVLPTASEEVAGLLGQATRGRRKISDAAIDCLKDLRGDLQRSAVATAFDSARGR